MAAGNIVRDCNKRLERFPQKNGLVRCMEVHFCAGGGAANVGLDLAALAPDMPVQALCRIGDDAAGDELLRAFAACPNIDTGNIVRTGQTAFSDVLTEQGSDVRSFIYYPGANAQLDIGDFPLENMPCRILHIGYILALEELDRADGEYGVRMARLMHMAREQGVLTSVDVVSEASDRYKTNVPPCLAQADFFFCNEIEAGRTLGMELRGADGKIDMAAVLRALHAFAGMGAAGKVLIHMPEGAAAIDARTGETAVAAGAILPDGAIRATVGAGDAFCAGALIAAYQGKGLEQMLECGIAAATACLQNDGPTVRCTLSEACARLGGFVRREI